MDFCWDGVASEELRLLTREEGIRQLYWLSMGCHIVSHAPYEYGSRVPKPGYEA